MPAAMKFTGSSDVPRTRSKREGATACKQSASEKRANQQAVAIEELSASEREELADLLEAELARL